MSATVRHSSLGVPGSKRGAATVYVREREFANEEDFNQWFKDEKVNWRSPHTRDLSANKTEEYQCRYARMKNYRCSIKLRVLYPQDNFKVIVEQSKGSHDHVPVSQPKLSDQHKELMKQELDSTALIIQGKIQKTRRMGNDPLPPSIKQINSFKYRQKKEGIILSIEQLKTYAEANSRVPEEDDDKSFVCAFASSIIDQKQHLSKVIQVDATYKLNWHGFPVMVIAIARRYEKETVQAFGYGHVRQRETVLSA
uniref:MULE transposase domain-containing protein n=1 Tax=Ditylenchus dipsaci TaxID=166011 RepID=A0A915DEE7_9BILA